MTFKEFLEALELTKVIYKPGAMIPSSIPKTGFVNSGGAKINPVASVPPSKPYQPIFRMGKQAKTTVANRKH